MKLSSSKRKLIVFLTFFGFFCIILASPVSYTGADTYGTLIVSESIIRSGTISLDNYKDLFIKPDGALHYSVRILNGHIYSNYPVGPSLLSLPLVAAINSVGIDVVKFNQPLQKLLAAITSVIIAIMVYLIGKLYFTPLISLLVSMSLFFGSILSSTLGTAPWSINFEIVFISISILLLLRHEAEQGREYYPYLLGLSFFCAYLSRPTAASFILPALIYLFIQHRKLFWKSSILSGLLFAVFSAWHFRHFGTVIPLGYSTGGYFSGIIENIGRGFYMLFFSPSRNLLIWNPFILILPLLLIYWRTIKRRAFPIMLLASVLFLFAINSISYGYIWSGHSYGPRTSTLIVFILAVLWIIIMGESWSVVKKSKSFKVVTVILLLLGVLVNIQGLYNSNIIYWNLYPNVDLYPEKVIYDWRYPQFLTNRNNLHEKASKQLAELGLHKPFFIPYRDHVFSTIFNNDGKSISACREFENLGNERFIDDNESLYLKYFIICIGLEEVDFFFNNHALKNIHLSSPYRKGLIKIPRKWFNSNPLQQLRIEGVPKKGNFLHLIFVDFLIRDYAIE